MLDISISQLQQSLTVGCYSIQTFADLNVPMEHLNFLKYQEEKQIL